MERNIVAHNNNDGAVLDYLIKGIIKGRFSVDERLPSENQLASRFGVSRMVVRKAYSKLVEMGRLVSRQGQGHFLAPPRKKLRLNLRGDESFTKKLAEMGHKLTSKTVLCKEVKYSEKMWPQLEADPDERVYRVGRLRIVDGVRTALHVSYVREGLFPSIAHEGPGISSMFAYFENHGHHSFISDESVMSITLPTQFEQEILDCPPLIPLLLLEGGTFNQNKELIQYSKILYRSDLFKYVM